jgi:hypothetical protein
MANIILVGLPSSGKTTFLAALWYLVEGNNKTVFTVDSLDGDREFLNNMRDSWLLLNPVDRTPRTNEHVALMGLVNTITNKKINLRIPDLSGETFLDHWINRSWTHEFHKLISEADGIFFFIHPDQISEPIRIDEADYVKRGLAESEVELGQGENPELHEWERRLAPTQVQLVEILQFFQNADDAKLPLKLCVIISAWDLVSKLNESPESWLRNRLPLLWQYLFTNKKSYPSKIFGVSAQGGDYQTDEEKLSGYTDPQERILIVESDGKTKKHDLTIPLHWLMSEQHEE